MAPRRGDVGGVDVLRVRRAGTAAAAAARPARSASRAQPPAGTHLRAEHTSACGAKARLRRRGTGREGNAEAMSKGGRAASSSPFVALASGQPELRPHRVGEAPLPGLHRPGAHVFDTLRYPLIFLYRRSADEAMYYGTAAQILGEPYDHAVYPDALPRARRGHRALRSAAPARRRPLAHALDGGAPSSIRRRSCPSCSRRSS